MSGADTIQQLSRELTKRMKIVVKVGQPPELGEPVLFFFDYDEGRGKGAVSFALPIGNCQVGGNFQANKCWATCLEMEPIGDLCPNKHPPYLVFPHNTRIFRPYSIQLQERVCNRESIMEIIDRLYQHAGDDHIKARTTRALGGQMMWKIESKAFCILGCGAVGSLFAELLVRSGATHLNLVDGDEVERSNLNRTFSFTPDDVEKNKARALEERLKKINPEVNAQICEEPFEKERDGGEPKSHSLIKEADIVIVAMDNNESRIAYEKMRDEIGGHESLSIGVYVGKNGHAYYEAWWNAETPEERADKEGYGDNGSYASIVMEATAAGFGMLLAHLNDPDTSYKRLYRRADKFIPAKEKIEVK